MKKSKKFIITIATIIAALYLFNLYLKYYGDLLWFKNMGYGSVFNTISWFLFCFSASIFILLKKEELPPVEPCITPKRIRGK